MTHTPQTLAGTPAPVHAQRGRDPFFDNAKLLAMVAVVVGHAWEPLRDSQAVWAAYLVVYLFHMPAFIVISGYFSRSADSRPDRVKRLITGIAVPYLIFELAYNLFARTVGNKDNTLSLTTPWYLTWFLVALFIWRLTAPIWRSVRWPLPVATAISLLACSTVLSDDLSLDRVLQFLPFFVLGLLLTPDHWRKLQTRWIRPASVAVFAGAAVWAYSAKPYMTAEWAYHRRGWSEMDVSWQSGLAVSLALMAGSLLLTTAFLAWVPRRRTWYTPLGEGTLYAYLLHGFLIRTAEYLGWYDHGFWYTPAGEVAVTAIAVTLALLLTTPPVRRVFRCAVEPRMDWAFRMPPRTGPEAPAARPVKSAVGHPG